MSRAKYSLKKYLPKRLIWIFSLSLGALAVHAQPLRVEDPAGFFALELAPGLECTQEKGRLECTGAEREGFKVNVSEVSGQASLALIALTQRDIYKKEAQFKLILDKKLTVDQTDAIVQAFSYNFLGKVQLASFVQQLFVVRANKLFTVEFRCSAPMSPKNKAILEQMYQTLQIAKLSTRGMPVGKLPKPDSPLKAQKELMAKLMQGFW